MSSTKHLKTNLSLKRSLHSLFFYATFIGAFSWQISRSSGTAFIIYSLVDTIFIVELLYHVINRNYIVLKDETVILYRNFLVTRTFPKDQVKSIFLEFTPFKRSYFELMDGSKIKFSRSNLSVNESKKLELICNNMI